MSIKLTYFVHGTTVDNENKISSGWHEADLSDLGIKQAKELGVLTEDNDFDVLFCSDLKRAVDSAHLAFPDKEIIEDERLRECNYGDFNAHPSSEVEPMQEVNIDKPFPNGESYEDVKKRIEDFLESLKKGYDGKHIAIVAHKAPQLALDVILKGYSWEEAFEKDWRKTGAWQPGWEYMVEL